ncbi:MAG: hypothetical protein JWP15_2989 [Alphaproteobacteria bacterium]|nr:hypothetical protein [Alphaproteobacteria bacterium]
MSQSDFGKPPLLVRLAILLLVLLLLVGLPLGSLLWMISVPGRSWTGPLPPLDRQETELAGRLETHVRTIASEPHNVAHPEALERAAAYLERNLVGSGYRVRRQSFAAGGISVRNLEVAIAAAAPGRPALIVGAHYDSFGDAPGANDNGSGAAALLELARSLRDLDGRSAIPIRLVLFVNEEPPFFQTAKMGSLVYARALANSGVAVMGMISLETLGFYSDREGSQHYPAPLGAFYPTRGDFAAFVGRVSSRDFVRRTTASFRSVARFPSEGGTAPSFLAGIDWSDHWSFAEAGMPSLMVTDTAPFRYPYYHSPQDSPDKVDYRRLARVVSDLGTMIRTMAEPGAARR